MFGICSYGLCVFLFVNYIPSYKSPRGNHQLCEVAEEPVWQAWLMLQPRVREEQAVGGQGSDTHYTENLGANKLGKAQEPPWPALMPAECGVSAIGPARVGTFDVGCGTLCAGEWAELAAQVHHLGSPAVLGPEWGCLRQMTASSSAILMSHGAELGAREV